MQSLETQLLKSLAYLPSQNDFSTSPPPRSPALLFPLRSRRRWTLHKRGGCAEKWTWVNLGHIVPMHHAKWTSICMSIRAHSVCTHGRNIGLLYGMTGVSILQPWPGMKRGQPGPLRASGGPAACCGLSLDHCLSCCWSLCGFWLG